MIFLGFSCYQRKDERDKVKGVKHFEVESRVLVGRARKVWNEVLGLKETHIQVACKCFNLVGCHQVTRAGLCKHEIYLKAIIISRKNVIKAWDVII